MNSEFRPPFCPYPACRHHLDTRGWRWIHCGFYSRKCEPRIIQRFRCVQCERSFSTQTFSTTYYLKRPELQIPIFFRLIACSGYRQIARRAAVLMLWRNFSKQFSERKGGGTPAMRAGIKARPIPVPKLFKERLFPTRIQLPRAWREYYWRKVPTRRIVNPRLHDLVRAF